MQINISGGGSHAGWRRVLEHADWQCACDTTQPGTRYSCPDCGERRPAKEK